MSLLNRVSAGAFAPLQNRNYRIYVTGQAISLIGTFMQQVALQWLIWDITHDTRWTGVVNALLFVPMFFLGPFSGAVADRVDRRKLLIATQVIEMLLAFALAALVAGGLHSIGPVLVIALIAGITTSFNFAATWAFVGDLSGTTHLRAAVAFSVTMLEIGRLVGPALAGWVVGLFGTAPAFALNGLSFIAVIISLLRVRANQEKRVSSASPLSDFREALHFLRGQPRIRDLVLTSLLVQLFVFPSLQLSAPIADVILKGGPQLLGWMLAASGGGALIGALIITPRLQLVARAGFALLLACLWAGAWLAISALLITRFASAPLTVFGIFFYSISIPVVLGGGTALIQVLTPGDMRARVLTVTQMVSFAIMPIGALLVGWLASVAGPASTILILGLLMVLASTVLLLAHRTYREWVVARPAS